METDPEWGCRLNLPSLILYGLAVWTMPLRLLRRSQMPKRELLLGHKIFAMSREKVMAEVDGRMWRRYGVCLRPHSVVS
jgi:hypothetical protein